MWTINVCARAQVALCCTDVDNSSIISHYWGLCATAVSVVLVAVLGREACGPAPRALGTSQVTGLLLLRLWVGSVGG